MRNSFREYREQRDADINAQTVKFISYVMAENNVEFDKFWEEYAIPMIIQCSYQNTDEFMDQLFLEVEAAAQQPGMMNRMAGAIGRGGERLAGWAGRMAGQFGNNLANTTAGNQGPGGAGGGQVLQQFQQAADALKKAMPDNQQIGQQLDQIIQGAQQSLGQQGGAGQQGGQAGGGAGQQGSGSGVPSSAQQEEPMDVVDFEDDNAGGVPTSAAEPAQKTPMSGTSGGAGATDIDDAKAGLAKAASMQTDTGVQQAPAGSTGVADTGVQASIPGFDSSPIVAGAGMDQQGNPQAAANVQQTPQERIQPTVGGNAQAAEKDPEAGMTSHEKLMKGVRQLGAVHMRKQMNRR